MLLRVLFFFRAGDRGVHRHRRPPRPRMPWPPNRFPHWCSRPARTWPRRGVSTSCGTSGPRRSISTPWKPAARTCRRRSWTPRARGWLRRSDRPRAPQPRRAASRRNRDPDLGRLESPGDPAMGLIVLIAAAAWISPSVLAAQTGGSTHTRPITLSRAVRTEGILRIDGRLDEGAWASAAVTDSFIQIDPAEGKPASQRSEVRVLYDDDFLYVGALLHDSGRSTSRLGRRDMDPGDSDWFAVLIDRYPDHRTPFAFEVNPAGF